MQSKNPVVETAIKVCAIKSIVTKPSFWKENGGTRSEPLVRGDHYRKFLGDFSEETILSLPDKDKIQVVGVREREINKIFEDQVKKYHCQQVVILGAGYDIRSYKKNRANQKGKKHAKLYANVKYWEVDDKALLVDKAKRLGEDKNSNSVYIAADYTKIDLVGLLKKNGVDVSKRTLFIWEGNSYYLEKSAIQTLFTGLTKAFKDIVLVFDYFSQERLNKYRADIQEKLEAMDKLSPSRNGFQRLLDLWKTGFDDLTKFSDTYGLRVIRNQSTTRLAYEYKLVTKEQENKLNHSVCMLSSFKSLK